MSELENNNELQDDIQEIKEFQVKSDKSRGERKKAEMGKLGTVAEWSASKKALLTAGVFSALAIAYLVVAIWLLEIHPVVAALILIIQAGIGVLLDQNPIWVHALVLIAELAVGIWLGLVLFMVITMLIYAAGIGSLEVWQRFVVPKPS